MKRDVPCKCEESLLDTLVDLGTGLEEPQAELVRQLSPLLDRDIPLLIPITLVANENLVDAGRSVLFDLRVPGADVCW